MGTTLREAIKEMKMSGIDRSKSVEKRGFLSEHKDDISTWGYEIYPWYGSDDGQYEAELNLARYESHIALSEAHVRTLLPIIEEFLKAVDERKEERIQK